MNMKRYFAFIISTLLIVSTVYAQNEQSKLVQSNEQLNQIDDSLSPIDTKPVDIDTLLYNQIKLEKKLKALNFKPENNHNNFSHTISINI